MDKAPVSNRNLLVDVRTPDKIIFQGEAQYVSSVNGKGPFDILGQHENFISLIKDTLVIFAIDGKRQQFPIDTGILKVYNNQVSIFIGIVMQYT